MNVMVFGTFDLLHEGHRFLLSHAAEHGDLTVVVARSAHVLSIKQRAPVQSEEERMHAVRAAFPSATVLLGDESDFLRPVRETQPDLIVFGYDQRLPPGVSFGDFTCFLERLPAHHPTIFKSSLMRS